MELIRCVVASTLLPPPPGVHTFGCFLATQNRGSLCDQQHAVEVTACDLCREGSQRHIRRCACSPVERPAVGGANLPAMWASHLQGEPPAPVIPVGLPASIPDTVEPMAHPRSSPSAQRSLEIISDANCLRLLRCEVVCSTWSYRSPHQSYQLCLPTSPAKLPFPFLI